jgi:hypothetical protein
LVSLRLADCGVSVSRWRFFAGPAFRRTVKMGGPGGGAPVRAMFDELEDTSAFIDTNQANVGQDYTRLAGQYSQAEVPDVGA